MFDSARALWPAQESTVYKELSGDGKAIVWSHLTTGSLSAIKVYFVDETMCTIYAGKRDSETLLGTTTIRSSIITHNAACKRDSLLRLAKQVIDDGGRRAQLIRLIRPGPHQLGRRGGANERLGGQPQRASGPRCQHDRQIQE